MKSHELQVEANKQPTRPGRGISAGRGKTAGRGTKGQNSRSGGKRRPGFEGGQNPIMQRLPKKRGFRSYKTPAETVYTGQLDALGANVGNQELFDAGLIDDLYGNVKVVVKGEITKKHTVSLAGASASAVALIEKAGGQFTQTATDMRPKQTKDSK